MMKSDCQVHQADIYSRGRSLLAAQTMHALRKMDIITKNGIPFIHMGIAH